MVSCTKLTLVVFAKGFHLTIGKHQAVGTPSSYCAALNALLLLEAGNGPLTVSYLGKTRNIFVFGLPQVL